MKVEGISSINSKLPKKTWWPTSDGIVLRMTWNVYSCPKRMCSLGINGEGELRG